MHIILHIFKKDVRRLWWGIAIALLLRTAAAWFDAKGAVALPLGWLLLVTWATLLALAIHEDPLVGDRQFWITRPARWLVLLGSKLLFALAVVHVPSFIADIVVLAARGFRPWEWLGSLLIKQIMLAAEITLPMIALAVVLRSFAHLALAVIGIVGVTLVAFNFTPSPFGGWASTEDVRFYLMAVVFGAAAIAVVWWQFARRRTWRSRLVGIAGVVGAELILVLVSPIFLARVRAAFDPAPSRISFHLRNPAPDPNVYGAFHYNGALGFVAVPVPLNISGIPTGMEGLFGLPTVDIIAAGGEHLQSRASYIAQGWLILEIPRTSYQRLKTTNVELRGAVPAILYRVASSTLLPVGVNRPVPGMGRCSTELFELPGLNPGERHTFVRIACESPKGSPLPAFARFWETPDSDRSAQLEFRSAAGFSPLVRAEASFPLAPGEVPPPSARFELTNEIPQGWQVVNLDLRDIRLGDYVSRWASEQ